jgi:hypothetical protein
VADRGMISAETIKKLESPELQTSSNDICTVH